MRQLALQEPRPLSTRPQWPTPPAECVPSLPSWKPALARMHKSVSMVQLLVSCRLGSECHALQLTEPIDEITDPTKRKGKGRLIHVALQYKLIPRLRQTAKTVRASPNGTGAARNTAKAVREISPQPPPWPSNSPIRSGAFRWRWMEASSGVS